MSNRLSNPNIQWLDNSGQPLSGGRLRFFITSTSTPTPTYSDPALTITNGTVITLDSAGRSPTAIFLDPAITYKVSLETAAGVVLWTADPVVDLAANVLAAAQVYAGNPNTHVAGNAGTPGSTGASLLYDITNGILYVCTTTGNAASAVWTAISNSFTGNEDIYNATQTITAVNIGRVATANSAAAITFNLTAAATIGPGKLFGFKNIGVGTLTLDPAGGELIEGAASVDLSTNQGALVYCTGSAWRILAKYEATSGSLSGTTLTLTSTDGGSSFGPNVSLIRASATPAASDYIGALANYGRNSAAVTFAYLYVIGKILDATAGSEDSAWEFWTTVAGTIANRMTLAQGLQLGTPAGGDKGAGTINAENGVYAGGAQLVKSVTSQVFTSNGTYTPTVGMLYCVIEAVGGGAGGGGCANSTAGNFGGAGGGGGGSYSRLRATAATIGVSQAVTIGAAANGGAAGNNNGTAGNDTSVGVLCIGKGGGAGQGAAANATGAASAGGVAGTGDFSVPGQAGDRGSQGTIITVGYPSGRGGASGFGFGSPGAAALTNANGSNGGNYGAGGGGGNSSNASGASAGGNGAQGIVVITEYVA